MATGISSSMSTSASTYIVARVSYSETYDEATNTSSVTATLAYKRTNTYAGITQSTGTYYVRINGTDYAVYTGLFQIPARNNDWHTVGSKTVTGITHNADGSKTISIGGSHSGNISPTYMNFNMSQDVALTTIPRASQPSINTYPNNSPDFTVGDSIYIHMNRKSSAFTHTVSINIGGTSYQIATGVTDNVQLDTSDYFDEFMAQLETQGAYSSTVSVITYNGTTQIGTATCAYNAQVNTTLYKPTITSVAQSDTNVVTTSLESSGTYIKGRSNYQAIVSFGVSDTDYVTLANATISCGSTVTNYPLSETAGGAVFAVSGIANNQVKITVTDMRGTKTTQTINLTLIDYAAPQISEVSIYRVNSNGDPTDVGDYIHYSVKVNCFDGSFGQQSNTLTLKYKYKLTSSSAYGSETTVATHTGTGTGSVTTYTFDGITGGGNLSYTSEYNLVFKVEDTFASASSTVLRLNQGLPVFAWGSDHFDVYGEIHVHDRTDPSAYRTYGAKGTAWTSFGTVTGSNVLQFTHSDYEELLIVAKYVENVNYTWIATAVIPSAVLTSSDQYVLLGARIAASTGNDKGANVKISTSGASIYEFANNRSYISGAELTVYYR